MVKCLKTLRFPALLSVTSGAAVGLLGLSVPAKAAEERLRSNSFKVYGLVPPGEGSKNATNGGSIRSASAGNLMSTTAVKSGKHGPGATASNEATGQGTIAN